MKERGNKSARKSRNLPRQTSRQSEVSDLLTQDKAYSEPNTQKFREKMVSTVLGEYPNEETFVRVVCSSVESLRLLTTSPLEIADLIKAFAIAYPVRIVSVLEGIRKAAKPGDVFAEGLALGAFEAANSLNVPFVAATHAISKFLGYTIGGKIWQSEACIFTPHTNGRLSQALSDYIGPFIWFWSRSDNQNRFDQLMLFVAHSAKTDLKGNTHDTPRTLNDYLVNEIAGRIFLTAPPAFRIVVLKYGLPGIGAHRFID